MSDVFGQMIAEDLRNVFFNPEEFGEEVLLQRGETSVRVRAMFDSPSMQGQALGSDAVVISHQPRLFLSASELPDNKVEKYDLVTISSKAPLHKAGTFEVVDFANESDGVIVCHLHEVFS